MADNQKKKKSGPSVGEILDNPGKYPEEEKRVREIAGRTMDYIEHAGTGKAQDFLVQFNERTALLLEQTRGALDEIHQSWHDVIKAFAAQANISEEEAEAELSKAIAGTEYEAMRFGEFIAKTIDAEGNPVPGGLIDEIIKNANLPSIKYNRSPSLNLSIDKIATVFFGFNAPSPARQIPGQLAFDQIDLHPVKYEKTGANKEITLYYNYTFDRDILEQLGLKEEVDDQDYFILSFLDNIQRNGNDTISLTMLYKDMHGVDPNSTQLTELTNRVIKLSTITVYLNDSQVLDAWNVPADPERTQKGIYFRLAPIVLGDERYIANGKVVQSAIKIESELRLLKIGRQIGQFTTVQKSLLQVKTKDGKTVKKTKRHYRALRYLLKEVARMKNGTRKPKLLYSTFLSELNEKTPRGRQLAMDQLFLILDHFVREGWIIRYKEETTRSTGDVGLRIYFPDKKKKIPTKK